MSDLGKDERPDGTARAPRPRVPSPTSTTRAGIRRVLTRIADRRWAGFFARVVPRRPSWTRAAVRRVRDVAARLAQPESTLDAADEILAGAWAVVRDAMDRSLGTGDPTHTPSLEATA